MHIFDVHRLRFKPSLEAFAVRKDHGKLLILNGFFENSANWHALCIATDIFTGNL